MNGFTESHMWMHEPNKKVCPHAMDACATVPAGGRATGLQRGNEADQKTRAKEGFK